MRRGVLAALLLATVLCRSELAASEPPQDPRRGRVPLSAEGGWQASLVHDQGDVGIWVAKGFAVLDGAGSDEVVGLDDQGTLRVFLPYSGKWNGLECLHDGGWLNALCQGDLDPGAPGRELYTGGQRGNLWQVVAHLDGTLEGRLVGQLRGEELQTLVEGDLDPAHPGHEMLLWCWPGDVHVVRQGASGLALTKLETARDRVRDAVVLPAAEGMAPQVATVSRGGRLCLVTLAGDSLAVEEVFRIKSGMGRIAMRAAERGPGVVLYTACDDGRVFRFERTAPGAAWTHELIYAGPLGCRGVVSGRFDADAGRETVAIFGYSGRVELLARGAEGWSAETIFRDRDKGHWICAAEVDGRNATPELFVCGYGGRVVMLQRPPGYGLDGVLADPEDEALAPPLRIALGAAARKEPTLTPLVYYGGFRAKTLVYETLTTVDGGGRAAPGLAVSWERLEGGRRWVFTLRDGARFHDGSPCDAAAVRASISSWLGKEEHDWLGMNRRVDAVEVLDSRRIAFRLKEPYPLPFDLAAVNPCSIASPGAAPDAEPFRPVGTGPYEVVEHDPLGETRLRSVATGQRVDLVPIPGGDALSREHVRALELGRVDGIADGWRPQLPRADVERLAADERFVVERVEGTLNLLLAFNRERAPFADVANRLRLAAAVDRTALVRDVELGYGTPCASLFAPSLRDWPDRPVLPAPEATDGPALRVSLPVDEFQPANVRLASALARQAARVGITVDVDVLNRAAYRARLQGGDFDLRLTSTDGVPYDPHLWLVAHQGTWPEVAVAVGKSLAAATDSERAAAYREVQEQVERHVLAVPLYCPDRVAVRWAEVVGLGPGGDGYHLGLPR